MHKILILSFVVCYSSIFAPENDLSWLADKIKACQADDLGACRFMRNYIAEVFPHLCKEENKMIVTTSSYFSLGTNSHIYSSSQQPNNKKLCLLLNAAMTDEEFAKNAYRP